VAVIPSNGGMQGATVQTVAATQSGSAVDMDFTADGIGMNDITVAFFLGCCSAEYRITDASLVDDAAASAVPTRSASPTPAATALAAAPQQANGWNLEVTGKAQAGPIYSADGLIIDVDQPAGNAADVQYAREGVTVTNGTTYTVHFRARSAETRTIHVEVEDASPSHTPIGLSHDVQLTGLWQDYNLTFTAQNAASGQGRIALMLGGNSGTIQIAEADFANPSAVSPPIEEPQASPLGGLGPIASWELDTQGGAEALVSPDPTGAVVEVDRVDGAPAHVILKQDGIGLAEGTQYELRFKAKSTVARQVPIIAQVDGGVDGANFRMIGCNDSVHMTPEWQDYDVKFTAVGTVPQHSRIAFLLGGMASTVELSDVALHTNNAATQTASAAE
jgi:hypothetical protein